MIDNNDNNNNNNTNNNKEDEDEDGLKWMNICIPNYSKRVFSQQHKHYKE